MTLMTMATDDPLVATDDPLVATDDPLVATDDPLVATDDRSLPLGHSLPLLTTHCHPPLAN
jgi:hypothetical protein